MNLKQFAGVVQSATQRGGETTISTGLIDVEAQVRTQFIPERQESMNASIKAQGILQSLVVLAKSDGRYQLIAGEYRLRGAVANGLSEVPVRIKQNLTEWEIRRIQVSENLERTDISAFDEAMGVAADVDKFGFAVAKDIWNRSEGWVSKRTAVLKYAEPVRQLLKDGICNDLEVGHSLNQIHELDVQEYERLEKRLRDGLPLSREEARGKVHQVKEWKNEAKQRDARRQALGQGPAKGKPSAEADAASGKAAKQNQNAKAAPAHEPAPAAAAAPAAASVHAASTAGQHAAAGGASNQAGQRQAGSADGASQISSEQALVLEQMVTLFQNGLANHGLMKDVQAELADLGADMNQTEWAMWSLYQTAMLPLLAALGEQRAQRYLQRTVAELRNAKAQELWSKLHPVTDGVSSDDWSTARTPVAPMPKNWRF
jgi:ParB family chromosome partitioning protein